MANQLLKNRAVTFTLIFTILLISTNALTIAQNDPYPGPIVINIKIDNSGSFIAFESNSGITYEVAGTPDTNGTVTTRVRSGNPYATADIPEGVALTKFIEVIFDFPAENFMQAKLIFTYSNEDVATLEQPYAIYKYIPETETYVELEGVLDTTAKTITIILTSTEDPLFAIGGTSTIPPVPVTEGVPVTLWIAVAIAVIIIVLVVFIFIKRRYSEETAQASQKSGPGYWKPGV